MGCGLWTTFVRILAQSNERKISLTENAYCAWTWYYKDLSFRTFLLSLRHPFVRRWLNLLRQWSTPRPGAYHHRWSARRPPVHRTDRGSVRRSACCDGGAPATSSRSPSCTWNSHSGTGRSGRARTIRPGSGWGPSPVPPTCRTSRHPTASWPGTASRRQPGRVHASSTCLLTAGCWPGALAEWRSPTVPLPPRTRTTTNRSSSSLPVSGPVPPSLPPPIG